VTKKTYNWDTKSWESATVTVQLDLGTTVGEGGLRICCPMVDWRSAPLGPYHSPLLRTATAARRLLRPLRASVRSPYAAVLVPATAAPVPPPSAPATRRRRGSAWRSTSRRSGGRGRPSCTPTPRCTAPRGPAAPTEGLGWVGRIVGFGGGGGVAFGFQPVKTTMTPLNEVPQGKTERNVERVFIDQAYNLSPRPHVFLSFRRDNGCLPPPRNRGRRVGCGRGMGWDGMGWDGGPWRRVPSAGDGVQPPQPPEARPFPERLAHPAPRRPPPAPQGAAPASCCVEVRIRPWSVMVVVLCVAPRSVRPESSAVPSSHRFCVLISLKNRDPPTPVGKNLSKSFPDKYGFKSSAH